MAFDDGEIAAEVGKKNGQVEFVSQSGQRDSARFQLIRSSHIGAKPFLKRDEVFMELKKLTGSRMPGTQTLCAANARLVLVADGWCAFHFLGAASWGAVSWSQPGSSRVVYAVQTS